MPSLSCKVEGHVALAVHSVAVFKALNAHGDPNCVNFAGYSEPWQPSKPLKSKVKTRWISQKSPLSALLKALMLSVGGGYVEVVAMLLQEPRLFATMS